MTIGTFEVLRTARATSSPSTRGSPRSRTMRSGAFARNDASASRPSDALASVTPSATHVAVSLSALPSATAAECRAHQAEEQEQEEQRDQETEEPEPVVVRVPVVRDRRGTRRKLSGDRLRDADLVADQTDGQDDDHREECSCETHVISPRTVQ